VINELFVENGENETIYYSAVRYHNLLKGY